MDADEDHDYSMEAEVEPNSLMSEFKSWRLKQDNNHIILLDKIERHTEGTASLHLR